MDIQPSSPDVSVPISHLYACRQKATGQQFAVKIIQKTEDAHETEKIFNSGLEETMTIIGLDHPKILTLHLNYILRPKGHLTVKSFVVVS